MGIILLTTVHVIVCLFLVVVVLLQSGKAADLAGAFGGMGSQTVFGPRGSATVLSKATTIAAALFMVTSLSLSVIATRRGGGGGALPSLFEKTKVPITTQPGAQTKQALPPQPGTIPLNVRTDINDQKGQTQTIQVPVQTAPPKDIPGKAPAPATGTPAVPQQKK